MNLNPTIFKSGARHHRGNSDGVPNLTSKLHFGHHTRGSSGSNGFLKTFEDNIEAACAMLSQALEVTQDGATNSRTKAHTFHNYYH